MKFTAAERETLLGLLRVRSKRVAHSVLKTPCWVWQGSVGGPGYGQINRRVIYAQLADGKPRPYTIHCLSWVLHHGVIPDGLFVLHNCDVRCCWNPEHLKLGDDQLNSDDKYKRGRANHRALSGDAHPLRRNPTLAARGEGHGMAVLTVPDVLAIRRSEQSTKVLAQAYKISVSTIKAIRSGRLWKHLR